MKKFTGFFTLDASKALKGSERLFCRTTDDGEIYVTNGYTAYKMAPHEYAAIVQPVTCCEAGNYFIQNGEKREEEAFDLIKTFHDAVKAAEGTGDMARCPLVLTLDKKRSAVAYYNAEKDFVALYDTRYISALCPGFTLRAPGPTSAAVAYSSGEPFALVLPVRPDDKTTRAVKAYFTQAAENNSDEAEQLRAEIARLQDKLNQAEAEANELRELAQQQAHKIEAMQAAEASKPQGAAVEPKTAAEMIAARWANVEGVTVTVKGAQTAAPVVWLSGSTKPHTKEIEAAGGHWSHKKNAYYFRVA